jgi:hypothetical protein
MAQSSLEAQKQAYRCLPRPLPHRLYDDRHTGYPGQFFKTIIADLSWDRGTISFVGTPVDQRAVATLHRPSHGPVWRQMALYRQCGDLRLGVALMGLTNSFDICW